MPSLHVAWAVWCVVALYPVARHRVLRILAVAYPVMTALVVVATGNHYFLDVAAGALLTGMAWVAVTRLGGWAAALRRHRGNDLTRREGAASGARRTDGARPAVPGRVCGRGLGRPVARHRFCAAMRPGRWHAASARPRPGRAAAEHGQPGSG